MCCLDEWGCSLYQVNVRDCAERKVQIIKRNGRRIFTLWAQFLFNGVESNEFERIVDVHFYQ